VITSTALRDIGLSMAERAGLPMDQVSVCGEPESWHHYDGTRATDYRLAILVGDGMVFQERNVCLGELFSHCIAALKAWKESQPDATS